MLLKPVQALRSGPPDTLHAGDNDMGIRPCPVLPAFLANNESGAVSFDPTACLRQQLVAMGQDKSRPSLLPYELIDKSAEHDRLARTGRLHIEYPSPTSRNGRVDGFYTLLLIWPQFRFQCLTS